MSAIAANGHPAVHDAFIDITPDTPAPSGRDLRIDIEATAVNPVDTKVRRHLSPDQAPKILGWDAVGIVRDLGPEAATYGFKPGDRVFYAGQIDRPGSYSSTQLVDARLVAHAPSSLEIEESAALPLTALTAWEGLFDHLNVPTAPLSEGEPTPTLLVMNGAGGVGSMVIQLAKALTPLRVIATASRPETQAWCKSMGADLIVDHHGLTGTLQAEGIDDVDYIFNCHDIGDNWQDMVTLIKPFGRINAIAETDKPVDLSALQSKSASFSWTFMFTRALNDAAPERQGQVLAHIARLVDEGTLRSTLSEVIGPLSIPNIITAHKRLESGKAFGKLVLTRPAS